MGTDRRPGRAGAAVALAAACLGVLAAPADEARAGRFRDKNAKFSFQIPENWDQVPLETEGRSAALFGGGIDRFAVCRFAERGAEQRGAMATELYAYRMGGGMVGMKAGETTPSESTPSPFRRDDDGPTSMRDLFVEVLGNYGFLEEDESGPRSMEDWEAARKRARDAGRKLLDPQSKAAKAVKSKDGVPGTMWTLDRSRGRGRGGYYLVFAAFKKEEVEVGLWLVCEAGRRKKFEQPFKTVVSTFRWFDEKADDVESKAVLEGLAISPAKRRAIERGLVKGWDVVVSPKKNYVILYNTKNDRNHLLAKIIAERIEQIRGQVYEVQFPPAKPVTTVCIARVCGDRMEYHHYGGPGGSAGYWNSDTEELVFYDASPRKEPDDDTLAVLYHEAFHQYIYYSVGEVAPHSWFNEGHGDYYAGAKYVGKKFDVRPFAWRVGVIQGALVQGPSPSEAVKDPNTGEAVVDEETGRPRVKFDRSKGGYTPLEHFVRMSQGEYYSYPSVCYAQGWSLVYFLREHVPKNPKWAEKWGRILPTYFDTLKAEVNRERPLDAPAPKGPEAPEEPEEPDEPGDGPEPAPSTPPPDPKSPPPAPPGMDEPGPPAPGPAMGDEPPEQPEEPGGGFVMPSFRFGRSDAALRKAVDEAFKGVDFAELEAAWRSTMRKGR